MSVLRKILFITMLTVAVGFGYLVFVSDRDRAQMEQTHNVGSVILEIPSKLEFTSHNTREHRKDCSAQMLLLSGFYDDFGIDITSISDISERRAGSREKLHKLSVYLSAHEFTDFSIDDLNQAFENVRSSRQLDWSIEQSIRVTKQDYKLFSNADRSHSGLAIGDVIWFRPNTPNEVTICRDVSRSCRAVGSFYDLIYRVSVHSDLRASFPKIEKKLLEQLYLWGRVENDGTDC